MAHTIYYLDASYWSVSSGSIKTYGMVSFETHAYILNPEAHNTSGFNKDKANMTKAEFNAYLTTLTAGETSIPNASDYTLANWTSRGWGSSAADVLQNYNKFIENNFLNGTSNRAINAANRDLTTLVVSGTIDGTTYFLPLAIYGGQGEAAYIAPQLNSITISVYSPSGTNLTLGEFYDIEATVFDQFNSPLLGYFVTFERYDDTNTLVDSVPATTDGFGLATVNFASTYSSETIVVKAVGENSVIYESMPLTIFFT
jgi:hypothetical protein